jgi:very-short-patch-repair endonuclease
MNDDRYHPNARRLIPMARSMRRQPTRAENILWQILRNRNLDGYKFKRQTPIDQYIVDFSCNEIKLIIELDGDVHAGREQEDELRTLALQNQDYKVIRFTNDDVFHQLDAVTREIWLVCEECRKARQEQPGPES